MTITGTTKVVGLLGFPIDHSLSPRMHNAAFAHRRLNWVYVPLPVHPDNLAKAVMGLRALGMRGVNVTIPHKEAVVEFLDQIDDDARQIGAVNTIVNQDGQLVGYNTDCYGFTASLTHDLGFAPSGRRAVVLGAGGAARALAVGLAAGGITKIVFFDIDRNRARVLAARIRKRFGCAATAVESGEARSLFWAVREADILLNATPQGMKPQDTPLIDPRCLHDGLTVFDAIYWDTWLVKQARRKRLRCANGLGMLARQAARAFSLWTGAAAPLDVMRAAGSGRGKRSS